MRRCVLFLIAVGLLQAKNYTGIINDNQPTKSAVKCPVIKPKLTLQTSDQAWVLSDQKAAAKFVGKKVIVEGTPGAKNELKATAIRPAR